MANRFKNGISGYIVGEATVTVAFPIDHKGRADVSCNQCYFFRRSYRTCGLNGEVCQFPEKYVGGFCPLNIKENYNQQEETNYESL